MITVELASGRFDTLATSRTAILNRAEAAAALTIPSLMPPSGHSEGSDLPQPYQSLGAKAVNTLSAKILLALFPPNTSFFKLNFDDVTKATLEDGEVDLDAVNEDISLVEQAIVTELEQTKLRPTGSMAFKHLIVTGNYVVDVMPSMNFRGFGLKHFVVNRDPEGNVLELVIKEKISPLSIDEETMSACFDTQEITQFSTSPDKTVDLFTVMQRNGKKYDVFQSLNKHEVPGSTGSYPIEAPRFVVLRWTSVTDEDYGRGMVDEYFGDIKALDDMSRDLQVASAQAAKILYTVDPNSHLTPKMLAQAKSGDVLRGKADDVSTIGLDKLQDFQVVLQRINDIKRDLAEAFLMNTSVQRDAERVTAEEIRFMAQELEDALGGVYSTLAQELQVPLLKRILDLAAKKKLIPTLPQDSMKLSITTGLEALGRGHEVNKLMQFLGIAKEILGEEQLLRRLDVQGILSKAAAGIGISIEGVILKEEDVQQNAQKAQADGIIEGAAPGVINEAMKQSAGGMQ